MLDSPEIQAMMSGMAQGQQSLAGMMPSSNNVGGAPPKDIDPASRCFKDAHTYLMKLANDLMQLRDEQNANRIAKIAVQVKEIELSRRSEMAEDAAEGAANGGGALSAVGGLNAMGVPGGMG